VIPALVIVLALAALLALSPPGGSGRKLRRWLGRPPEPVVPGHPQHRGHPEWDNAARPGRGVVGEVGWLRMLVRHGVQPPVMLMKRGSAYTPLTVLVQQSAALLRGGRTPGRLWEELWLLHGPQPSPELPASDVPGAMLAPLSLTCLVAARAAAGVGAPVGAAIRGVAAAPNPGSGAAAPDRAAVRERRAWIELAACFDIAEASGSPLADVLARFAAQLEAEDDAEAARETAFAGPRATVRLLSWLPVLGLGLGMALGVDPIHVLLGEPAGLGALAAGVSLTAAGRIWSAKLVRSAAGQPE
jgi:tight adherence protein B